MSDTDSEAPTERQFPCAQCGADMAFDPKATALTCPYCQHVNDQPVVEDEDIEELDFHAILEAAEDSSEKETRSVVRCSACGAESTFDPNISADECAFCGSAIVKEGASTETLKPRSLLPFKVDRKRAAAKWQDWIKGLWFAPSDLKKRATSDDKLAGMYVPYWTYDCEAYTRYTGQRGDDYWTTETYTATENGNSVIKTRRVKKTRWTSVSGRVRDSFDDILVLASRSLPRKITEKLEPWDLENLTPYSAEYLSGFRAETYQIDLEKGFDRAQEIMDPKIRKTICRDIGGDHQRIRGKSSRYEDITFKHLLLPIWISAYRYQSKVYRFVVNGRTGEVQGERPWSWVKITLLVVSVLAVGGTIAALFAQ